MSVGLRHGSRGQKKLGVFSVYPDGRRARDLLQRAPKLERESPRQLVGLEFQNGVTKPVGALRQRKGRRHRQLETAQLLPAVVSARRDHQLVLKVPNRPRIVVTETLVERVRRSPDFGPADAAALDESGDDRR